MKKNITTTFYKRIMSFCGKKLLMRAARFFLYHAHDNKYCWICGAAPGMGPIWAGPHMTCNECYIRWHYFHNDNLKVDWYGLGRLRNKKKKDE